MHKTMGFKQQSKKATRNSDELTNQEESRDQLALNSRQKTETKPGVTHANNSAVKKHISSNDY